MLLVMRFASTKYRRSEDGRRQTFLEMLDAAISELPSFRGGENKKWDWERKRIGSGKIGNDVVLFYVVNTGFILKIYF